MSISNVNPNDRLRAALAVQRSAGAYSTAPAAPARQADSVSLSESARLLSAAHKSVASAPDMREDRVQALKAAIANGTYTVDSQQLARAMASKLDLLG
jgi:negative regulator of flagellin synthesis FlgM